MYYIFYQAVESAVFKNQENGIESLLNYSRENNKKQNITGLLLYIEGTLSNILREKKMPSKNYTVLLSQTKG
ncbi:hypothetical protein A5893_08190 [Pedobacter psychrophilus]|uniref:BLUF domain-containing protein n=1 Tax=Pedobacter psychrophilus TaxID=1826909 RepID=A0A179DF84_9SPHI|nr:BLUF domain-containing protein [Pedobacter psychrophilus]OAQ39564.1 hypothetical protein A5893_08190 [Pedobacter psychrophilus]